MATRVYLAGMLAATLAGISPGASAQDLPDPPFTLTATAARAGTPARVSTVSTLGVPLDKPYAKLSAAQRQKWSQAYSVLEKGDEPPFPKQGLKAVLEPLSKAQQKLQVRGELFLLASVNAEGSVDEVKVIQSPDAELSKIGSELLSQAAFKPALCAAKPCAMGFPLRVKLLLK